jgi:hypothetical protein
MSTARLTTGNKYTASITPIDPVCIGPKTSGYLNKSPNLAARRRFTGRHDNISSVSFVAFAYDHPDVTAVTPRGLASINCNHA